MITNVIENDKLKQEISINARSLAIEKFDLNRTYTDFKFNKNYKINC